MNQNGSSFRSVERIRSIQNAFLAAKEQLCDQCYQFAQQNDLDSIRKLMSQMNLISARLRALNRFLDDVQHEAP